MSETKSNGLSDEQQLELSSSDTSFCNLYPYLQTASTQQIPSSEADGASAIH
jgi:hypothetical protein